MNRLQWTVSVSWVHVEKKGRETLDQAYDSCRGQGSSFHHEVARRLIYRTLRQMPTFEVKGGRRGFTLVELLVVIAIIAVLASILFPVLSRAKEAAKKTACLSNDRQLTLGVIMYAGDVDDVLPPVASPTNDPLWVDLVQPYIRNLQVRVCPDDQGDRISYGLNSLVFIDFFGLPSGPLPSLPTMDQFAFPAETIMTTELGTSDDLVTPRPNTYKVVVPDDDINDQYDARPSFRHFARSNLGFFDGHAQSRLREQFYVGWSPADYWFCVDRTNLTTCQTPTGQ